MRLPFALTALLVTGTAAQAADAVPDVAAPGPAIVEEPTPSLPFYVVGRLGGLDTSSTRFGTLGTSVSTDYDIGLTGSAALGAKMLEGDVFSMRLEAEVGFDRFDVSSHNVVGVGTFGSGDSFGDVSTVYGLANGFADFRFGAFTPFVGAGIGYAGVDLDGFGVTPTGTVLDDKGSGFAWQIGAGAAYDLNDRAALELGYRYKGVENVGVDAADGTSSEIDLRGHAITMGVRAQF